jgi:hypothetical protein
VPDDNSCLFSSLAIIFTQDITQAQAIRQGPLFPSPPSVAPPDLAYPAAADTIRADSGTFSEAILGCPREQYLATLLKPQTWGGALELAALAARFGTEIASVDVETGRVDAFPPPGGAQTRCIVFYAGIHYDAAVLAPTLDAPSEWHQTQFTAVRPAARTRTRTDGCDVGWHDRAGPGGAGCKEARRQAASQAQVHEHGDLHAALRGLQDRPHGREGGTRTRDADGPHCLWGVLNANVCCIASMRHVKPKFGYREKARGMRLPHLYGMPESRRISKALKEGRHRCLTVLELKKHGQ